MGKASELDDFLATQRLTPDEIRQRRLAEEISSPGVELTPDGQFVRRRAGTTEVIRERQTATWD